MSKIKQAEIPAYSGNLTVNVTSSAGFIPIKDATITISLTGDPDSVIETLTTNSSGQTQTVTLPAPNLSYSTNPDNTQQPYSEYDITVTAPGYEPVSVSGTEILPDVNAIQPILMTPVEDAYDAENETVVIPEHTLYGDYPPKIPEAEIKPTEESGEIVLSRVVIPEYVIVHDGPPQDASAKN